ncbi:MAG: LuxR C-terminal-related transcriptional regulator [Ancrocorticia sp.]|uniref:helix-turn-helix transcriptional regulator n=3 Tax=Ancrocorticia sp. TaxID=2593684 RepID=UPI003F9019B0
MQPFDHVQIHRAISEHIAGLTERLVITIDNFEYATSSTLDLALVQLLDESPLLDLVVSGRRSTSLTSPLVTSQYDARLVTADELAFTDDEVGELAKLYAREEGQEAIIDLAQSVAGWPLPVQIGCSGTGAPTEQFARIVAEYIDLAGEGVGQRVLYEIALCPGVSVNVLAQMEYPELTTQSTREMTDEVGNVCAALEDQGLIHRLPSHDRIRYSCHQGIASIVAHRGLSALSQEELRRLRLYYSVNIDDYDPSSAFRARIQIEDLEGAERMARRRFVQLLADEKGTRITLGLVDPERTRQYGAIDGLRMFIDHADPTMSVELKRERMSRSRESMRQLLLGNDPMTVIYAECALVAAEVTVGSVAEAYRLAKDLARRMTDGVEGGSGGSPSMVAMMWTFVGYAANAYGDYLLAERSNLKALRLAERENSLAVKMRALRGLSRVKFCTGDMVEAKRYLDEVHEVRASLSSRAKESTLDLTAGYFAGILLRNAALNGWDEPFEDQPMTAEWMADHAWVVTYPLHVMAEADIERQLNGSGHALRLLKHRLNTWPLRKAASDSYTHTLYAYTASLMAVTGDLASAQRQLDSAGEGESGKGIVQARIYLLKGQPRKALASLQDNGPAGFIPRQHAEWSLLSAVALWQLEMHSSAVDAAHEALRLMREHVGYGVLGWVPYESLRELAEYLRDSGDDSLYEYVDAMPENLRCHQYGRLSRAELRTLCELANGEPLENTAGSLFISINTLKFHLRSIYRKLHVSNRHEAVQRAQLLGLYTPNQSWGGMRGGKAKE